MLINHIHHRWHSYWEAGFPMSHDLSFSFDFSSLTSRRMIRYRSAKWPLVRVHHRSSLHCGRSRCSRMANLSASFASSCETQSALRESDRGRVLWSTVGKTSNRAWNPLFSRENSDDRRRWSCHRHVTCETDDEKRTHWRNDCWIRARDWRIPHLANQLCRWLIKERRIVTCRNSQLDLGFPYFSHILIA